MNIAVVDETSVATCIEVKNVLLFDTFNKDGIYLSREQITAAAARFIDTLVFERCIAGEGQRSVELLDGYEIDLDYVSHLVTKMTVTEEGIDVTLELMETPRGTVVRQWIASDDYRVRVRTDVALHNGLVVGLSFITVDIIANR